MKTKRQLFKKLMRILITAVIICTLFSMAFTQTAGALWVGSRWNPSNSNFQLGQLNANLGQLNANLSQTKGMVFTVSNQNDYGPGSFRQAIADSNGNPGHDTIVFDLSGNSGVNPLYARAGYGWSDYAADPVYDQTFRTGTPYEIPVTEQLDITDSVTIGGPGAGVLSVGSASPGNRIFNIANIGDQTVRQGQAVTVNIIGITVTSAKLLESLGRREGAALRASNAVVNLYQTRIADSEAEVGGAIYQEGGYLNIAQSTVTGNSAVHGGGVAVAPGTEAYITDSLLSHNSAAETGGAIANGGEMTIVNSTITENIAPPDGESTRTGIRSFYIDETGFAATVTDHGGLTVVNSTISNNGGYGIRTLNSSAAIGNTIIADNKSETGDEIFGNVVSYGNNFLKAEMYCEDLFGSYPARTWDLDIVGTSAPIDARLGPLQNNGGLVETRALLGGSPAINKANNCVAASSTSGGCMPFALVGDQRSTGVRSNPLYSRMVAGRVDIGSFESNFTDQPAAIEQCKNGGWQTFNNPRIFKNQGDCVSFVNNGR